MPSTNLIRVLATKSRWKPGCEGSINVDDVLGTFIAAEDVEMPGSAVDRALIRPVVQRLVEGFLPDAVEVSVVSARGRVVHREWQDVRPWVRSLVRRGHVPRAADPAEWPAWLAAGVAGLRDGSGRSAPVAVVVCSGCAARAKVGGSVQLGKVHQEFGYDRDGRVVYKSCGIWRQVSSASEGRSS